MAKKTTEIDFKEAQTWDVKALDARVNQLRREYTIMKLEKTNGLQKPHLLKNFKRDIAKLMTIKTKRLKDDARK